MVSDVSPPVSLTIPVHGTNDPRHVWTVECDGGDIVTVDNVPFDMTAETAMLAMSGQHVSNLRLDIAFRTWYATQTGFPVTPELLTRPGSAVTATTPNLPARLVNYLYWQATPVEQTEIVVSANTHPDLISRWMATVKLSFGGPEQAVLRRGRVSDRFCRYAAALEPSVGDWSLTIWNLLIVNPELTGDQVRMFIEAGMHPVGTTDAAQHPNLLGEDLRKLAAHPDPDVRAQIARRDDIPRSLLTRLSGDRDLSVSMTARRQLATVTVRRDVDATRRDVNRLRRTVLARRSPLRRRRSL